MVARRRGPDDARLARLGRFLWREGTLTALVVIALAGIGISIYLTTVHYAHVPLFCSVTSLINCASVTTSAYSVVPGTAIPITIPGMLWFLVSGGLGVVALRAAWRDETEPVWLRPAHFIWAVGGMAFVLYLVVVELDILHQICEWCTGIHVLTALTFIIVLLRLLEVRGAQLEGAHTAAVAPRASAARASAGRGSPRQIGGGSGMANAAMSTSTRAAQPVGANAQRTGTTARGGGNGDGGTKRRGESRGRKRRSKS